MLFRQLLSEMLIVVIVIGGACQCQHLVSYDLRRTCRWCSPAISMDYCFYPFLSICGQQPSCLTQ